MHPRATPSVDSRSGHKVLVVEDDADTTTLFSIALAREGHETRVVNCARDALTVAPVFRPNVIVIDIGLPDMDGYRLARLLRATPELADTRLIAVTGNAGQSRVARSIAAGFEAHLTKPVSAERLVAAVSTVA
jgi:two-component system, chemotaxis family, CheB/CheR fusion protein